MLEFKCFLEFLLRAGPSVTLYSVKSQSLLSDNQREQKLKVKACGLVDLDQFLALHGMFMFSQEGFSSLRWFRFLALGVS